MHEWRSERINGGEATPTVCCTKGVGLREGVSGKAKTGRKIRDSCEREDRKIETSVEERQKRRE